MSKREWKIGDWAERDGKRYLIILGGGDHFVTAASFHGGLSFYYLDVNTITHLPDCTGWDWQPPKLKVWREPTLCDLKNGPIPCRFKGEKNESWQDGVLSAIKVGECLGARYFISPFFWRFCEIEVESP